LTNSQREPFRIAVVGGGIAGLSAAHTLAGARRDGAPIQEALFEGRDRLGGVIRTERVGGFVIEGGPDSFLAEKPEAAALCRELGLGDQLLGSNDSARRTYILHRGRLVPLPDGLLLLVPTRLWPMAATPLLPLRSKLALAAEWFVSPPSADSKPPDDESVASFVQRHFGEAMVDNIVDPLLAGVYGGDCRQLSIQSVLPRFWEMERQYGSLTRATLRARRERLRAAEEARKAGESACHQSLPLFMTLKGGLDQMVSALAQRLENSQVQLGARASSLELPPSPGKAYRIRFEKGSSHEAEAIVLAMPAHECAKLLSPLNSSLATRLGEIPYSSSMTVSLAYERGTRSKLPPGFGFLSPRKENRRLMACTFVHGKFNYRAPEEKALVRCFLGGSADPEVLGLSDEEVVALVRRELQAILNFNPAPLFYRVHRWPSSMAQYVVGHAARVRAIEAELVKLPGLFLAGNAYSGIGISDCVRTGRAAAERALELARG
jgi:oxygen-dependent protoporphyrinogen oxidase